MFYKTEKARLELSPGVRTLSLRERSLLLLADGKSPAELRALYHGAGAHIVEQLLRNGYLCTTPTPAARPDGAAPASLEPASEAPEPSGPPPAMPPSASARSLAGARMYLFDLSERLFARRDPGLAERYRNALRDARDEASMRSVGRALLREVAAQAGEARAQALQARLMELLPAHSAHHWRDSDHPVAEPSLEPA